MENLVRPLEILGTQLHIRHEISVNCVQLREVEKLKNVSPLTKWSSKIFIHNTQAHVNKLFQDV